MKIEQYLFFENFNITLAEIYSYLEWSNQGQTWFEIKMNHGIFHLLITGRKDIENNLQDKKIMLKTMHWGIDFKGTDPKLEYDMFIKINIAFQKTCDITTWHYLIEESKWHLPVPEVLPSFLASLKELGFGDYAPFFDDKLLSGEQ